MRQYRSIFGVISLFLLTTLAFQNCGKLSGTQNSASGLASTNSQTSGSGPTGSGGNGQESIVVTLSPSSLSVQAGSSLSLTATVVDSASNPITYVWTLNGTPVGGNSSTLTMANVSATDNGATIVVVASSQTPGVSAKASVIITVSSSQPTTALIPIYAYGNPNDWIGYKTSSCSASDPGNSTADPCDVPTKTIVYQVYATAIANSTPLHNCRWDYGGYSVNSVGTYCDTGFIDRGIVGYISTVQIPNTVPIYKCTGSNPMWVWAIVPPNPATAGCTVFGWAPSP